MDDKNIQINEIINKIQSKKNIQQQILTSLKQYFKKYESNRQNNNLKIDDEKYKCLYEKLPYKLQIPKIFIKNGMLNKLQGDINLLLSKLDVIQSQFYINNYDHGRFNLLQWILCCECDIGDYIYTKLYNIIETKKTSVTRVKDSKTKILRFRCASICCFNDTMPLDWKRKFLEHDIQLFKLYMECAVQFPRYSGVRFDLDTEELNDNNISRLIKDEDGRIKFIYYFIFRTFKNNIVATYSNEVDNIFDESYLQKVGITPRKKVSMEDFVHTDSWFTISNYKYSEEATEKVRRFMDSILGYMQVFVIIRKYWEGGIEDIYKEIETIVGNEPIISNCQNSLSEGEVKLDDDEIELIKKDLKENNMDLSQDVETNYENSMDVFGNDTESDVEYSDGSPTDDGSQTEDNTPADVEDNDAESKDDDSQTNNSNKEGPPKKKQKFQNPNPNNDIEEEYNEPEKQKLERSRKKSIILKLKGNLKKRNDTNNYIGDNEPVKQNLEPSEKKNTLIISNKKPNDTLSSNADMEKKFKDNIASILKQNKQTVAPIEDFYLQPTRVNKNKLKYTMSYKRKGTQYSAVAEVQKKKQKIKDKETTEYECRLKEMKDDNGVFFKENIKGKNQIEIVSRIYKTLNGENYSDNFTKLNEKIKGPSYNSSDHKLIDLNGWVLYLDMVYPGQNSICTQSVIFCLIASIKNFELLENEPLNNGSVWIGSKNVKEAFYCYKNAFHICGYEFQGNHQYTLFNGLNFNLAHVSNDNQVHFKAPGREMKIITKETALEMKKDDIVKKIYILKSEEKNVREEITNEKKVTYLPRYFDSYLKLIKKRNPDLLGELNQFFKKYKESDEDYNYKINIVKAKLVPGIQPKNVFRVVEMVDKFVLTLIEDLNKKYNGVNLPEGEWRLFNPKKDPGDESKYFRSFPQHYSMHLGFKKVMDPFPLVYSRPSMTGTSHSETLQIESESDNEY